MRGKFFSKVGRSVAISMVALLCSFAFCNEFNYLPADADEDIVVQVKPYGDRFISLDGHTRLYLAVQNGFRTVKAVESETEDWVWSFVHEAERRNILCPRDLILLPHEQYEIQWNQYCDKLFAGEKQ